MKKKRLTIDVYGPKQWKFFLYDSVESAHILGEEKIDKKDANCRVEVVVTKRDLVEYEIISEQWIYSDKIITVPKNEDSIIFTREHKKMTPTTNCIKYTLIRFVFHKYFKNKKKPVIITSSAGWVNDKFPTRKGCSEIGLKIIDVIPPLKSYSDFNEIFSDKPSKAETIN